jgi:hypothetical protein
MWREICNKIMDVLGRKQKVHNTNTKLSDVQANRDHYSKKVIEISEDR